MDTEKVELRTHDASSRPMLLYSSLFTYNKLVNYENSYP